MSEQLNPTILFDLIGAHVPEDLRANILIVGSLAAAYHFRESILRRGINTKDADVIIQPAGAIQECCAIAQRLLDGGWRKTDQCRPMEKPDPVNDLRAVRLYPPTSEAYFIELLGFPEAAQSEFKKWIPFKLADGWYGLPTFRFLGLAAHGAERATVGLQYAVPPMMALSNLLSHPEIGTARMSQPIGGKSLLRSAKDLGRVLALARLSSRDEVEQWPAKWEAALRTSFPAECVALASRAGSGLRKLLEDEGALEEARIAVDVGILAGERVTTAELTAIGRQLFVDAIEPLAQRCSG